LKFSLAQEENYCTFAPALRAKRENGFGGVKKKRIQVHRHIGLTALLTAMLEEHKRVRE